MSQRDKGFTLLEMLLAIALLGLMMILVATALTSGRHTLETVDRYAARLTEIRAAQGFLRNALEQALPIPFEGNTVQPGPMFEGDSEHLRFVAPLPAALNGGLQTHTFTAKANSSGTDDLIVSFTHASRGQTDAWGSPQRILSRFENLQLSYRGLDDQQQHTGWIPTWPWSKRLPQYVRVELDIQGPVRWPPLVVALRMNPDNSQEITQ